MTSTDDSITDALERLALALGRHGAVPVAELIRSLERAADRLRARPDALEIPDDLVTQADAARRMGVSRQAVNQWVRKGAVRAYVVDGTSSRYGPEVSLAEIAVVANRRSREIPFSGRRRRELLSFLELLAPTPAGALATDVQHAIEDASFAVRSAEQSHVLRDFVTASMGVDGQQHEFDDAGLARLASLQPVFTVDTRQPFGRLSLSLGLLVRSADGEAGFDSPSAALLGLLGCATIGTQYRSDADVEAGRAIARVAQEVWGPEWVDRLQDATFQVGQLRPAPLTRLTASLTYLDTNRFLRNAQSSGLSVAYARAPGVLVPQCHYGSSILSDILSGRRRDRSATWTFSAAAAEAGRPESLPSEESPFRIFLHDSGLLDPQLHGIRRYCFSADDARRAYTAFSARLDQDERVLYAEIAVSTLARALRLPQLELVSIDDAASFDWWKDHISRASAGEILIGLRDEQARRTAHGLLVQTSILPEVVDAADSDGSLRERLRIYVKNLEFDVIDARYRDDLRRGGARMLKQGGTAPSKAEAVDLAKAILEATMDG